MSLMGSEGGPRPVACNYCRQKKIRCDGDTPCWNCQTRREICAYPPTPARRARRRSQASKALEQRLARLEELILQSRAKGIQNSLLIPHQVVPAARPDGQNAATTPPQLYAPSQMAETAAANISADPYNPDHDDFHGGFVLQPEGAYVGPVYHGLAEATENTDHIYAPVAQDMVPLYENPPRTSTPSPLQGHTALSGTLSSGERMNSIMAPAIENAYEVYKPGSLLSVLSLAGVEWVSNQTRESTEAYPFHASAQMLAMDITSRQRPRSKSTLGREPEPPEEEARRFVNAYFTETPETVMGIVHRRTFEEKLRLHFSGESADDDPGWYALRNAVYASGCRMEYSKASHLMSFEETQDRAWRFFENALSLQTELLYGQTDISAVQALVAMCYFIEGLGNQTLEYSLSSSALLLAQAKGLHHQSDSMDVDDEGPNRNWLFWAIYCYATHLTFLSGRAPVIDDDIITCDLPTVVPQGSTIHIELFTSIIKLCRVCSSICTQLSAIKTLSKRPEEVIQIVRHLNSQLLQWRDSLPLYLRPGAPIDPACLPTSAHLTHIIWLHSYYYSCQMAIHTLFAYPWNCSLVGLDHCSADPILSNQVAQSSYILIEAARNVILATKYISINASVPGCLLVFYPLVAFINCFIHIVKYPALPTNQSDIALMDVVIGHFGHLGFLSSHETTFLSLRNLVTIALKAVSSAHERDVAMDIALKNNEGIFTAGPFSFLRYTNDAEYG